MSFLNTFLPVLVLVFILGLPLMLSKIMFGNIAAGVFFWLMLVLLNFAVSSVTRSLAEEDDDE
jgi:hypothetical protein